MGERSIDNIVAGILAWHATESWYEQMTLRKGQVISSPFAATITYVDSDYISVKTTDGKSHTLAANSSSVPIIVKAFNYRAGTYIRTVAAGEGNIYWLVRKSNAEGLLRYTPSDLSRADITTLTPEQFAERYPIPTVLYSPPLTP